MDSIETLAPVCYEQIHCLEKVNLVLYSWWFSTLLFPHWKLIEFSKRASNIWLNICALYKIEQEFGGFNPSGSKDRKWNLPNLKFHLHLQKRNLLLSKLLLCPCYSITLSIFVANYIILLWYSYATSFGQNKIFSLYFSLWDKYFLQRLS